MGKIVTCDCCGNQIKRQSVAAPGYIRLPLKADDYSDYQDWDLCSKCGHALLEPVKKLIEERKKSG